MGEGGGSGDQVFEVVKLGSGFWGPLKGGMLGGGFDKGQEMN